MSARPRIHANIPVLTIEADGRALGSLALLRSDRLLGRRFFRNMGTSGSLRNLSRTLSGWHSDRSTYGYRRSGQVSRPCQSGADRGVNSISDFREINGLHESRGQGN